MSRFLIIWAGQAFSIVGSYLVQFALVWWLTLQTQSATVLSLAMAVGVLPGIFLGPVAGALVDRWNRRLVMILADAVVALTTAVLVLLFALGVVQVWHVYAALFVRAAGSAFHMPAMQASTTLMVPDRHLARIAGLNQSIWGVAGIASPPLGALLLEFLPMYAVLALDLVTALLAILPLLFLSVPQPERSEGAAGSHPTVLGDFRAGLDYVLRWPGMMMIMGINMLILLLAAPASALTPLIVTQHFKGGAQEYAWLEAAWGLGMIVGGLALTAWGGFRRRMATALVAMMLMGVGLVLIGLAPADAFWLAIGGALFSGLVFPIMEGSVTAMMQSMVAPEMQGRVLALSMSSASLMMPLGLLLGGPVADALGVQIWYLLAGLGCVAFGLGSLFVPAVVRIEEIGAPSVVPIAGARGRSSV